MRTVIWLMCLAVAAGDDPLRSFGKFFGNIGKDVGKEIGAVSQPFQETAVAIGSSQCNNVKNIFGIAYDQLEGENEPDLNALALEYRDVSIRVIFNITGAARLIPQAQGFNPRQKLFIFIHGFTDNPLKSSFSNISEALLNKGECNVLALDGSSLIAWLYLRSTTYVRFIGEKLGEVLASMVKNGVDPAAIHIIGHSLGAHISGFTGKTFTQLTGKHVGRITGLDPAGPCFSHDDPSLRLKASDAAFVDIIHTDGGVYGLKDPVGHVDFYPNSGSEQPDCFTQSCSHSRAWLYYAESVLRPQAFPAKKCKDWDAFKNNACESAPGYMGYACSSQMRGLYFLQTNGEAPYGLGAQGTLYNNNQAVVKTIADTVLKTSFF